MRNLPGKLRTQAEKLARENPNAIVSVLDSDGIFVFMSDSVSMLGYTPEEVVGHHYSEYYNDNDVAHLRLAVEDALLNDRSVMVTRDARLKTGAVQRMRGDVRRVVDEATGQTFLLSMSRPRQ